jgi:hypothetical protein
MNRYWTILPLLVLIAVPIGTSPSGLVIAIELVAAFVCVAGLLLGTLVMLAAGGAIATIGYAVAAASAAGTDIIGAAVFGLALLFVLDLGEFARRRRGAAVSNAALRGQLAYWVARAAIILGATGVLVFGAMALALIIPGPARAVAAGAGAMLAFAGALSAGIGRPDP